MAELFLRCDDITMDQSAEVCGEIWGTVHSRGLKQILGCVPRGKIHPLLGRKPSGKTFEWIKRECGGGFLHENEDLVTTVKGSLKKNDGLALHGYYHVNYTALPDSVIRNHFSLGVDYLNEVFGMKPSYFVPPFNRCSETIINIASELGMRTTWRGIALDGYIKKGGNLEAKEISRNHPPFYHPQTFEKEFKPRLNRFTTYLEIIAKKP